MISYLTKSEAQIRKAPLNQKILVTSKNYGLGQPFNSIAIVLNNDLSQM